jgi:drug/metabolite transporter superfamily protein YnfA
MAEFEQAAKTERRTGFVSEFWYFLKTSKKWWLLPIVVVLVLFGLLVFLSGTAAAPFIYTLF